MILNPSLQVSVIDFFARLWKIEKPDYWGYVTTCGTEGNLHAMLLARECHPDGIIYTSKETHYSIFKAARYYKMDCLAVPTLPSKTAHPNSDTCNRPFHWLSANIVAR